MHHVGEQKRKSRSREASTAWWRNFPASCRPCRAVIIALQQYPFPTLSSTINITCIYIILEVRSIYLNRNLPRFSNFVIRSVSGSPGEKQELGRKRKRAQSRRSPFSLPGVLLAHRYWYEARTTRVSSCQQLLFQGIYKCRV